MWIYTEEHPDWQGNYTSWITDEKVTREDTNIFYWEDEEGEEWSMEDNQYHIAWGVSEYPPPGQSWKITGFTVEK